MHSSARTSQREVIVDRTSDPPRTIATADRDFEYTEPDDYELAHRENMRAEARFDLARRFLDCPLTGPWGPNAPAVPIQNHMLALSEVGDLLACAPTLASRVEGIAVVLVAAKRQSFTGKIARLLQPIRSGHLGVLGSLHRRVEAASKDSGFLAWQTFEKILSARRSGKLIACDEYDNPFADHLLNILKERALTSELREEDSQVKVLKAWIENAAERTH